MIADVNRINERVLPEPALIEHPVAVSQFAVNAGRAVRRFASIEPPLRLSASSSDR